MEQNEIGEAVWELKLSTFKTLLCKEGNVQQDQGREDLQPRISCVQIVGAHEMGCSYLCCHRAERPEPGKSWRCFKYNF